MMARRRGPAKILICIHQHTLNNEFLCFIHFLFSEAHGRSIKTASGSVGLPSFTEPVLALRFMTILKSVELAFPGLLLRLIAVGKPSSSCSIFSANRNAVSSCPFSASTAANLKSSLIRSTLGPESVPSPASFTSAACLAKKWLEWAIWPFFISNLTRSTALDSNDVAPVLSATRM